MITGLNDKVSPVKFYYAKQLRKNQTSAEAYLWNSLRGYKLGTKFRRQQVILGYIADFYSPEFGLVVEVDGSSHIGRENYDAVRDAAMKAKGIRVLRFTNEQVLKRHTQVLCTIEAELKNPVYTPKCPRRSRPHRFYA